MDTDLFKAMNEHRKSSRKLNMAKADEDFDQFQEAAVVGGYSIIKMSDYHWNVYKNGTCVAQFWPSANKWQITKTGRIQHGDHESFRLRLRSGRMS
jgi:hypothetical protein